MKGLPDWMVRAVVITLISVLVGGGFAWAQLTSRKVEEHDKDIARAQEKITTSEKALDEVKVSLRRMEDKLDRALERRNP